MSTLDRGVEKGRREKRTEEGRAIVNSGASWIIPRNQSLSGDGPDGVSGRSDRSKSGDAHSPERWLVMDSRGEESLLDDLLIRWEELNDQGRRASVTWT